MSADRTGSDRWDVVADVYGTSPVIERLARGLAELVGVCPGDAVIDIGTGTGLALGAACDAAKGGFAVGMDRSMGMLQAAASTLGTDPAVPLSLVRGDGAGVPFRSASFDVVLAASVWQFLGYSSAALAEWHRLLRPGGRLGLSVPGAGSGASIPGELRNKYFTRLPAEVQEDFINRMAKSRPQPDLASALADAGFSDAEVVERSWTDLLPSAEDWWSLQWTHGVRFFVQALDPQSLKELKAEALERLDRNDDGSVAVTTKVLYGTARR